MLTILCIYNKTRWTMQPPLHLLPPSPLWDKQTLRIKLGWAALHNRALSTNLREVSQCPEENTPPRTFWPSPFKSALIDLHPRLVRTDNILYLLALVILHFFRLLGGFSLVTVKLLEYSLTALLHNLPWSQKKELFAGFVVRLLSSYYRDGHDVITNDASAQTQDRIPSPNLTASSVQG